MGKPEFVVCDSVQQGNVCARCTCVLHLSTTDFRQEFRRQCQHSTYESRPELDSIFSPLFSFSFLFDRIRCVMHSHGSSSYFKCSAVRSISSTLRRIQISKCGKLQNSTNRTYAFLKSYRFNHSLHLMTFRSSIDFTVDESEP